MAFKFVVFAALVAVAQAGLLPAAPLAYAAPLAKAVVSTDSFDANPSYSFAYDVQDALTGDSKNQQESRQGDVVQGSYSLNEADGTRRTVHYTADDLNGFNAIVSKEPLAVAAPLAKAIVPAPVAYSAPFAPAPVAYSARFAPAPVAYSAPLAPARLTYSAPLSYAAPIAKTFAPVARLGYAKPLTAAIAPFGQAGPLAFAAHTTFSTPYAAYAY